MTDGDASIWQVVGTAAGMALTGAVGWFASNAKRKAETATAESEAVVADANGQVYRRLIERINAAEEDIRVLRQEQAALRRRCRDAEDHIAVLQRSMIDAGLKPPQYQPFEMVANEVERV